MSLLQCKKRIKTAIQSDEVPKNSCKARSYSEINQKLFNVIETLLDYFQYVIKISFNNEFTKLVGYRKTTVV